MVTVPTQLPLLPPPALASQVVLIHYLALNATHQTSRALHVRFDFAQAPSEGVRNKILHFSGDFGVAILGARLSHPE